MRRKPEMAESIAELDANKSNLLMEAYMLIGTGEPEQAIERYALAAPIEERIAAFYQKQGMRSWRRGIGLARRCAMRSRAVYGMR